MKEIYTPIILVITLFLSAMALAQEGQKNFINYQGVARNADQQLLISETMTIGVTLKVGPTGDTIEYEESHEITTDANGVFSLKIGNGNLVSGDFNSLPWGSGAALATITMNGNEVGTTEMMAVPYALSSADNKWHTIGDDIENKNGGNVFVTGSLYASKDLSLAEGAAINEFSTDGTFAGNSDEKVPTQKAIKTYIDGKLTGGAIDADADPTNEIQDISLSGTDLSITDGSTIDLSAIIPPGGTDDQNAGEVSYDNTSSGLTATDAQAAIDELATGGLVDTDDQDLSLSGTTLQITDGTSVDLSAIIPPGGTDDQDASEVPFDNTGTGLAASDTQAAIAELASGGLVDTDDQDLSLSGTTLQITDGTSVDLSTIIPPGGTDDQDASEVPFDNTGTGLAASDTQAAIEELATGGLVDTDNQGLVLTGDVLSIEDGLGSVDLSDYFNRTTRHGLLLGDDGIVDGLVGTVDGQVAKWDAALGNWVAGTDEVGGGGGSQWETTGSDIYFDSGNVGIGTSNPNSHLHIKNNSAIERPLLKLEEEGDDFSRLEFRNTENTGFWQIAGIAKDGVSGAANSRLNFYIQNDQGAANRMTISGSGNVGIGDINPSEKLEVAGNIRTSGELHTSATGNANMLANAYGAIASDGSISSGSDNFSVTRTGEGKYSIEITGEFYVLWNYPTLVSRSGIGFIKSGSVNGKLLVDTFNTAGVAEDAIFNFVVYKP
ncbi:hypothetical protein [Aurantibacter sp.]|uniref:hypothetical protein n=1 Tax=Aurantibacter sp. TaxID=2807103 RepID=UPI003263C175